MTLRKQLLLSQHQHLTERQLAHHLASERNWVKQNVTGVPLSGLQCITECSYVLQIEQRQNCGLAAVRFVLLSNHKFVRYVSLNNSSSREDTETNQIFYIYTHLIWYWTLISTWSHVCSEMQSAVLISGLITATCIQSKQPCLVFYLILFLK